MAKTLADLSHPILMLVTEPTPSLVDIAVQATSGGVASGQWRDKSANIDDIVRFLAPEIIASVSNRALLVANLATPSASVIAQSFNPRLDGLHFPEGAASGDYVVKSSKFADLDSIVTTQIRCHGPGKLGITGESVHSVDAAKLAESSGADYIVAGTIFATTSHPDRPGAGLDYLAAVCKAVSIPVIAIGGITPENTSDCLKAGAAGVAVLSRIMHAGDPMAAAADYRAALNAS